MTVPGEVLRDEGVATRRDRELFDVRLGQAGLDRADDRGNGSRTEPR
ncbi:hypothetical protein [Dactylosporangium sp. CA-233914]